MKKTLLAVALVATSANAFALSMPSAPSSPTGYDEVRTSDGSVCRSNVGGNLQMYGGVMSGDSDGSNHYDYRGYDNRSEDESGLYVGFAYSFGGGKRINCDRLATIETERAELELQKLKSEIKALEKIRELQLLEANGNLPKLSRTSQ